jgi:cytochrome P450
LPETVSDDPILVLAEPGLLSDPYPYFAFLRNEKPVFFYDRLDSWMFSTYADCSAVLRDTEHFAADWRRVGEQVPPRAINMLTLDPPEHTAVRRLFMEAMRAQDSEVLRRVIIEQTADLLASLQDRASFDFVTEFAEPLALSTTAAYLGVPVPADGQWISRIGRDIGAAMDAGLWPERARPVQAAHEELAGLVDSWLVGSPETGVLGALTQRTSEVAPDIVANTVRGLLFSGYSSGSKLLALAVVAALHQQAFTLADMRAADPIRAVDELVRYASPIHAVARACVTDTQVGDTFVRAGQAVTLLLGAANRDETRFPDAEAVRLRRHPNPHLGFGRGPKACLGSPFSAVLVRVVLGMIADRYPAARAVGSPTYQRNLTLRSLERFDVRLS